MRTLQDKTVDSALRYLHRECMNGRHKGLEHVLALMLLRGVEPDFNGPDADRREQVHERHLARGEDRPRGRGELLAAGAALPLATGGDEVGLGAAAIRAKRLSPVLRKADRGERLERLVVGHAVDVLELKGPGGGREEEVLGHLSYLCLSLHKCKGRREQMQ